MQADLTHLLDADTGHALEIAPRVWWVGHVLEDDIFQCHVYLLEQGRDSVLFDPGSRLTLRGTLRKIEEVIPFTHIRYFVCHHQDPDITAAMPLIDELIERPDACLVTHWRTRALLKHYGLRLPFWLVEEHDWRLPLGDRELRFVFTPYAHFPGAICTFDPATGVLFSSDLFGGFTEQPALVARDESYFEAMRPFHEHYIPSRDILAYALNQIERHPVEIIAPQHGSIIPGPLVRFMIEKLRDLDCGLYLFAQDTTDIRRLSRLNQTLRDITQTMLLYRDFRDIADRLCQVVSRDLPVDHIDYYALLAEGRVLTLSHQTRFSGVFSGAPAEIAAILGMEREVWEHAHRHDSRLVEHRIYEHQFCGREDEQGRMILTLPMFSAVTHRMEAVALVVLRERIAMGAEEQQVIRQLMLPLQVALEREVIYRSIESEREKAYQRSIRDSLTGLFSRFYMQDVMQRHCSIHDRDEAAAIGVLMIDIDHFKQVNDRHGHAAGDEVLRQVAGLLRKHVRDIDVPVRFGGEEFAIFLIGASPLNLVDCAERIRSAIEHHGFQLATGLVLPVTASLGAAARAQHEPLDDTIRRADEALYAAKHGGRNRFEIAPPVGYEPPTARP